MRRKVEEGMSVNDVYDIFKGTLMKVTDEVVRWRHSGERTKEMHG